MPHPPINHNQLQTKNIHPFYRLHQIKNSIDKQTALPAREQQQQQQQRQQHPAKVQVHAFTNASVLPVLATIHCHLFMVVHPIHKMPTTAMEMVRVRQNVQEYQHINEILVWTLGKVYHTSHHTCTISFMHLARNK